MDLIKKFEPFFGEWYAESFIGAGSFGRVYKIYREELGNKFYSALKYISIPSDNGEITQLRSDGMDNESISTYYTDMARDISSEITLMNKLSGNTNIVSFEDSKVVQKPDGVGYDIFIRMELLQSLTSRMIDSPLTVKETVKLGQDICNALARCKKNGIIHRDIKPDNIFISNDGDYKLGDFGIARQLEKTATFMSKKGTYNYMAPEVYKGEKYGATCDLYSLGLVMYRLLNKGRLPFLPAAPDPITANDREMALQQRFKGEPLPAPCEADETLRNIIIKACAFKPEDRFSSAGEMKKALLDYSASLEQVVVPDVPAGEADDEPEGGNGESDLFEDGPGGITIPLFDLFEEKYEEAAGDFYGKTAPMDDEPGGGVYAPMPGDKPNGEDALAPDEDKLENGPSNGSSNEQGGVAAAEIGENEPVIVEKKKKAKRKKRIGLIAGIAAAMLAGTIGLLALTGVLGGKESREAARLNKEATFTDYEFIHAFYDTYGYSEKITMSDILGFTELSLYAKDLTNINDVELFKNITSLNLKANNIQLISSLSTLTKLVELDLSYNNISDISALSELTNLRELSLIGNNIDDLSPLCGLRNLEYLNLRTNPVSKQQIEQLQKQLPNCAIYYDGSETENNETPTPLALADVNDIITFGHYEQDNNISNGTEGIEWLVLAKEDNSILVISQYALDCQPYHSSYKKVTWQTCSLREWLNETFLNAAFSEDERAMIPIVIVKANKNKYDTITPYNPTKDQVFLLSVTEAYKYFSSGSARLCQGTAYCYARGASKADDGNCRWWLRSSTSSFNTPCVDHSGLVNYSSDPVISGAQVDGGGIAVRPAMWIDFGS